jgi:hypothetical protein
MIILKTDVMLNEVVIMTLTKRLSDQKYHKILVNINLNCTFAKNYDYLKTILKGGGIVSIKC